MRLLIACPECGRQYDASRKQPGSRFRCYCGAIVTVTPPKGHDARVIHCSACGAPREEGSRQCAFCGADFTLHERDLDTVCPKCMARISDRARFCHHCGTRVAPESVAGDETRLACPACGESHYLSGRRVADMPVLECGCCAGLWLGNETFKQVTEKAAAHAVDADAHFTPRQASRGDPELAGPESARYRKCPRCGQLMTRRNYARRSGVILDMCRDHGVWFDADELPRIIHWVRAGGLARAERERTEETDREKRLTKAAQATQRETAWMHREAYSRQFGLAEALAEAAIWLWRISRR